jgi:acyl dehydratase
VTVAPYAVVARNIDPDADNAIHADDVAQQHGFSGALVPGVELFAYATSPLVAAWGPSWLSSGLVDLRFRRPVYDGEALAISLAGPDMTVTGPAGVVRCVGPASPGGGSLLGSYVDAPLPEVLPTDPVLGPLGSVAVSGTVADNDAYLDAIGEPVPLYRERSVAHPGLLLRLVNLLLMRNVALGPWVHTSSRCRFLDLAALPADVVVRGTVTELFQRGGHDYVRYDALVLADDRPVLEVDHTAIYRLG